MKFPKDKSYKLIYGDCYEKLKNIDDNSIDAMVCDPPAGISFMGMEFDSDKGGRDQWIAWLEAIMNECFRTMKPGSHAFVWALPRTSHWTATAIENAGFEIRDIVVHLFGSGFPKSANVSKMIDSSFGFTQEVIEEKNLKAPVTDEAKQWEGFGTALKPSSENWILARKPISEKTVAANVLKHGTGALNITESRVGNNSKKWQEPRGGVWKTDAKKKSKLINTNFGRWPANTVFSHNEDCKLIGTKEEDGYKINKYVEGHPPFNSNSGIDYDSKETGKQTVEIYECSEGCPVKLLNEQSGKGKSPKSRDRTPDGPAQSTWALGRTGGTQVGHNDSGGASRFFKTFHPFKYMAKPAKREKDTGVEKMTDKLGGSYQFRQDGSLDGKIPIKKNSHPTVKGIELMEYLIKLITPPNGIVLDPFMGSCSTGIAAIKAGFKFIGIEKERRYFMISKKRIMKAKPDINLGIL